MLTDVLVMHSGSVIFSIFAIFVGAGGVGSFGAQIDKAMGAQTAYYGFLDRYRAVPGDMTASDATDAIGVASYFVWFIGLITMARSTGATAMVSRRGASRATKRPSTSSRAGPALPAVPVGGRDAAPLKGRTTMPKRIGEPHPAAPLPAPRPRLDEATTPIRPQPPPPRNVALDIL